MAVMAAGVHHARILRGIGQACGLRDGQRVNIRAQQNGIFHFAIYRQIDDRPGLRRHKRQAEFRQLRPNHFCRFLFLKTQFRVHMKPMIDIRQLFFKCTRFLPQRLRC